MAIATWMSRWRTNIPARRLSLYVGFVPLMILALIALVGPPFVPYDPERADPRSTLLPPGPDHWFGTNSYGADVFSRVIYAARLDLFIAFVSVAISFAIAVPLGAAIGYSRRWLGGGLMRGMDFLQSFPVFILAMAIVAVTGQSVTNVVLVIAVLNVPIFVRLMRTEVLALRERTFVEAARGAGNSDLRLVFRHILPNAAGPALSQASVNVGWALLLVAGVSFVGAGVPPPTAEWGVMIGEGARNMITGEWWISVFPGIALGIAVLAFALAGDALRSLLDVRTRDSG
jgi:peptide/nickel transport system permease protein